MKHCFFIGHRDACEDILPSLVQAIEQHIVDYGVTEFIVGNYGGFDRLAAKAVVAAKQKYPGITVSMLTPYHPTQRPIKLPQGFDTIVYPSGMETAPRRFAIVRANRYMIDHVDYLIAYAWHPASNAQNLIEYAEKKGVPYSNLGTTSRCADCL